MKKIDVQSRKIVKEYKNGIVVTRYRDSEGNRYITCEHPDVGKVIFDSGSNSLGNEYEQIAAEFAHALEDISYEPCLLGKK